MKDEMKMSPTVEKIFQEEMQEVNKENNNVASETYNLTDLGNAERMVSQHRDNIRYCHPWRKWLVWDGKRWAIDRRAEASRYCVDTIRHMYAEAEGIEDKVLRTKHAEHAIRSESEAKIRAMLSLAKSQNDIPVLPEALDKNPWLLNVENGTVDLQTATLLPHAKENMLTKLAPANYNIEAECPKWYSFVYKIMQGNEELIKYLQRVAGYCLTGKTGEHKLFFLYGGGRNGKSTFVKVLQGILGNYAIKADSEILINKPAGAHTTAIMDLKGTRLAITIEVQEGRRLAEALTKELTGGDTITARKMRQDNESFEPTHKIMLAANHKLTTSSACVTLSKLQKSSSACVTV